MTSTISYRCYCACGGLTNPRLSSRVNYDRHGNYIGTTYHDSGNGPLTVKAAHGLPSGL